MLVIAACGNAGTSEPQKKTDEPPRKLAGVYPENFRCDSIASEAQLATTLGGAARQLDTPSSIPRGVPHPCNYEVQTSPSPEYWTFDFDCRPGYKTTADALFAQYTQMSGDNIAAYNVAADAAPVPDSGSKKKKAKSDLDAGIDAPQRVPEASKVVAVGARGLDHNGQGILFLDDDAPCYVRVVGPDQDRRLALAQLIATNLTFANAPMTPRPFK